MNKEKMKNIKERLDLFPNNMNKPAQEAYYELFDYIESLEQALDEIENYLEGAGEMACYSKSMCLYEENIEDILDIIQKVKGDVKNEN